MIVTPAQPNVYASRRITLVANQQTKILDFSISESQGTWQAWVFSNDPNNKSTLLEFNLLSTFGSTGTIEMTIGGGALGGGLLTGTGACVVLATGKGNNDISVWFVDEQTSTSLPPDSDSFTIVGAAGTVKDLGYPPFGRNKLQVQSNGSFVLTFVDDNGNLLNGATLNSNSFSGGFYQPSNTKLRLTSTNPNQVFVTEYFR